MYWAIVYTGLPLFEASLYHSDDLLKLSSYHYRRSATIVNIMNIELEKRIAYPPGGAW